MLGCSQMGWRSQWWLKASLWNNQMFCLTEKPYQNIVIQQNEKFTQGAIYLFENCLIIYGYNYKDCYCSQVWC